MKIELSQRVRELPPYLFAHIDTLKAEERRKGGGWPAEEIVNLRFSGSRTIRARVTNMPLSISSDRERFSSVRTAPGDRHPRAWNRISLLNLAI